MSIAKRKSAATAGWTTGKNVMTTTSCPETAAQKTARRKSAATAGWTMGKNVMMAILTTMMAATLNA